MRMFVAGGAALCAAAWSSGASANLVVDGGFEGGVFASTIDGYTNAAPVGWTPSAGYDVAGNFNSVTTSNPHGGSHDLLLGNDPFSPLASLSQPVATVAGAMYAASFYIADVWPTGFMAVSVDGVAQATVTGPSAPDPSILAFTTTFADGSSRVDAPASRSEYVMESFQFIGTGSDVLTIAAENGFGSYQIDDVSISLVPEPSSVCLALVGFGTVWSGARRRPAAGTPAA